MSRPIEEVEPVAFENSVRAELARVKARRAELDRLEADFDRQLATAIEHARTLFSMESIADMAGTTRTTLYRCVERRRRAV